MHIAKFLALFSRRDDVAIEPEEDVLKALLEFGCKDEVYFFPDPKLNSAVIRGSIEHYDYPVGVYPAAEKVRCALITYSAQMPHEWQRLVECKELLHILDPIEACTRNEKELEHLASKIVLPPELQDPTDGYGVYTDRVMVAFAVAVLFPLAAREMYVRLLAAGAITLADIAEEVGIPYIYVNWVMSDMWPEYHARLLKFS